MAINRYMWSTTIAIASPTNALPEHTNGVFPLPLYTHSSSPFPFSPSLTNHVVCNVFHYLFIIICFQSISNSSKMAFFLIFEFLKERVVSGTSERVASATRHRMKQRKPQRIVKTIRKTPILLPSSKLPRLGARSACVTGITAKNDLLFRNPRRLS